MSDLSSLFNELHSVIKELRGNNGCPWDKRQNSASLIKYLRAECEELVEAIENSDDENICEELGDLLYLVVIIAQINDDDGKFTINQVISGITEKLIRRHPHVFAGKKIHSEEELHEQWQMIKAAEKAKK